MICKEYVSLDYVLLKTMKKRSVKFFTEKILCSQYLGTTKTESCSKSAIEKKFFFDFL